MRRFDKTKNMRKANLLAEQRYLTSKGLINEDVNSDIPDVIKLELDKLGVNPNEINLMIKEDMLGEDLIKGVGEKFKSYKDAVAKTLVVCAIVGGAASCQKKTPHVYKFSYGTEDVAEPTSPNQYATLATDDGGTMTMQPYAAKTRGSWYELEDHKLSEAERKAEEEKLYLKEKGRLEGNNADYTITDYKLEYMGQSKRGDIATTNGTIHSN